MTDKKSFASRISVRSGPRPRLLSHDSIQSESQGFNSNFRYSSTYRHVYSHPSRLSPILAIPRNHNPSRTAFALSQPHARKGCWQFVNDAMQVTILATTAPNSTQFLHLRMALSNPNPRRLSAPSGRPVPFIAMAPIKAISCLAFFSAKSAIQDSSHVSSSRYHQFFALGDWCTTVSQGRSSDTQLEISHLGPLRACEKLRLFL